MEETKITLNRHNCLGCSLCQSTAPNVFEIDDTDGLVKLKKSQLNEDDLAQAQKAKADCPADVINIAK